MFDHVALNVSNAKNSREFYEKALKPLGYSAVAAFENWTGFGKGKKPQLWIVMRKPVGKGTHVALAATDRKAVDAFYKAALAAGGKDNGKPGLRKDYSPTYYGAFVLDPDGNNIEAVCHKPADAT
jgi:catechol 2,3-dioxygenase-like lactoylglutathione lyase family enzyme